MLTKHTLTLLLATALLSATMPAFGQDVESPEKKELEPTPVRKWYWGNGLDAAIFSTSVFKKPDPHNPVNTTTKWTTMRFSYFVNFGFNFNYDFDEHFGMFTGLGIKNIGLIEQVSDSTIKRRVYTIGAPLGFKLGNLQKRNYLFIGGGLDVPFNYREKGFRERRDKVKMNEWFSDRTEHVMPYLFAGVSMNPGMALKVQYYPGNFFNTDFSEVANGVSRRPFRGYEAHLIYLSLGFDIHYKQKPKAPKESDASEDANDM